MNKAEELQSKFEALCDEQEKLYKPEFEAIFNALYSIDEGQKEIYKTIGWNMGITLPDEPDTNKIEQAIKKAGFTDEALNRGFTRYAQIVIDGKKIMQEQASTKVSNVIAQKEMAVNTDEWQFVPISIIAPEPIMKEVISPLLEVDAKTGKGLFANHTDIPEINDDFDEFLMIEVYGLNCTLHPFFDELRQYNIIGEDGLLEDEIAKTLLKIIGEIMCFIKENTNKPIRIQNHIKEVVTNFDNIPIWGLLFQILVLKGLCKVIEGINISEGDNGYYQAQSLYNWLTERLAEKEIQFCYVPYGDDDKQILKPLCSYLYSTELGQMVQNKIFKNKEPQQAESNKDKEQAKRIRLKEVCELLNDVHNDTEHPNKIINYVRTQIENNGHLINGVEFIDYIKSNLVENSALTIYGRGNSLLDKDRIGNLFELLDTLKFELSKVDNNRQNNAENSEPQQANNGQTTGKLNLPSELNTERARKYIVKAIEAQYIKVTDNGLKWVFGDNKGQARLGYFCNKVYSTPRPINKLEETFGVKKLSSSISNADNEAKRADVIKWKNEIDNIFND